MMPKLTHFDAGGAAHMVDVSGKQDTAREAVAEGFVRMPEATLDLITGAAADKGDVIGVARLAGIMGAKKTAELIPLCHPLALSAVEVELSCCPDPPSIEISATCRLRGRTGVEMEALTAVSIAALTVYDMCKAVDRGMRITDIRLRHKAGGKSGTFTAD
jgi:cyclic pyranopterin monophosphate synthase